MSWTWCNKLNDKIRHKSSTGPSFSWIRDTWEFQKCCHVVIILWYSKVILVTCILISLWASTWNMLETLGQSLPHMTGLVTANDCHWRMWILCALISHSKVLLNCLNSICKVSWLFFSHTIYSSVHLLEMMQSHNVCFTHSHWLAFLMFPSNFVMLLCLNKDHVHNGPGQEGELDEVWF